MRHKLGLLPLKHDKRTLLYSDFRNYGIKINLPPSFGVPDIYVPPDGWGMLANGPDPTVDADFPGAGDCFWAGRAHGTWATMMRAKQTALANPFTAHDVLRGYSACMGYHLSDDPNNPSDVGTDPIKGLNYCRKTGLTSSVGVGGVHKLGAYMALEAHNPQEILEALYLFGSVGLGIQVPDYAEDEFEQRRKWSVRGGGEIVGGHWIEGVSFDHIRGLQLVTWGSKIPVSWGFIEKYCDAPFALLSPEILDPVTGQSHEGFDLKSLTSELKAITA